MTPQTPAASRPLRATDTLAEQAFTLVETWRTIRKYWATAVGTAIAIALGVTFFTLGQRKIYQAASTVQFDPTPPRPLGKDIDTVVDMGAGSYWNNREYYETQYKVIQSMRVALAVARQLDLPHDAAFLRNAPPGGAAEPTPVSLEQAAQVVRNRLSVEPVRDSRLALVRYEDANPERAQRVLATLVDTYIEQNLDDALESTTSAADWLRGQLDKLKGDLDTSEMSLHEFKLSKNILSVAFDDQSNMLREEMKQLSDALTSVRTRREELLARRAELFKISADDPNRLPANEMLQSVLLQALRQRYEDAVRDRDGLLGGGKGPHHPDTETAEARVGAARTALLAEVRNIQGGIDRDFAVTSRQETGLSGLFEKAKKQAMELNLLEIEYNRLRRTKENTEKLYQLVLERTKESDLARMMRVNNLRVVDRPLVPRSPLRPNVPVNIAVGIAAGIFLGIVAALGQSLFDRTLKTPDDIERDLGAAFLGLLPIIDTQSKRGAYYGRRRPRKAPSVTSGKSELIVHDMPGSGIAEAARAVRTNLMFMSPDAPQKYLLVSSASPEEGKTTVACCIAIAMAQAGQRVLLLDCDLRRPRVHRVFDKPLGVGVTTALLDPSIVTDELIATSIPNLSVLPAGPIPPNPAELFHSERFKKLLHLLGERFDRVIIDSPPVVAVTDAAILGTLADACVLVVRAFRTRREVAREALRLFAGVGAKTAGVVLNSVDLERHEYKYYHYYYRRDAYTSDPTLERMPTPAAEARDGTTPPA